MEEGLVVVVVFRPIVHLYDAGKAFVQLETDETNPGTDKPHKGGEGN